LLCGAKHFVAMSADRSSTASKVSRECSAKWSRFRQLDDVEPFVEQEVDITSREKLGHAGSLSDQQDISDRS